MRVGTVVDHVLTGSECPPVFNGERRGNVWREFVAECAAGGVPAGDILTAPELEEGAGIARCARANPLLTQFLTGRPQVPLKWETQGVPRSTRGIDCVGDGWISDLKVSNSAEPDRLSRHARTMLWHAQLADYADACAQNGIDTAKGLYLVVVEASAPHPATVMKLSARALEEGRKCIATWIEQYKACVASGVWPGYVQSVVELEIDDGYGGLVGLDVDE
jgi:hypothetical protein